MSLSSLRVTGGHGGHLIRAGAPKRFTLILLFYLILGCGGGFLVLAWYGLFEPAMRLLRVTPQNPQNPTLPQFLWLLCIALEGLLLVRGAYGRLFRRYPFFYLFLALTYAVSLTLF